jgi:hypothetical protein
MFSLDRLGVVNYGNDAEMQSLRDQLSAAGYRLLQLNAAEIKHLRSLFGAVSKDLLEGETVDNWDGLKDSLRNALLEIREPKIALLVTSTHQLLEGSLPELVTLLDILTGISRDLSKKNRVFLTFLLGEGPNFRN